jgi:galactitol-specific phosphotransferase system IIC component
VKVSRRHVGRRTFLAVAGLGACGAGVLAAPRVASLAEQGLQQAAFTAASGELDQLEGVSLDAALKAAQITAAAVHVIVVPVARLVATLGSGGVSLLLAALDAAHNALAFVHVSTTPIDLLRGVIASWQAGLASLPIALDTYASADIASAEAYLTALKRKVAQQQKGASA